MQAVLVARGARPSGTWHDNVDGIPPLVFFHFTRFLLGPGAPSAGIIEELFVFRQHSRLSLSVKDLVELVDPLSAPVSTFPGWAWASGPLGRHGYLTPTKGNRRKVITLGFNHTPTVKRSHSECQRCIPAANGVHGKYLFVRQHTPCSAPPQLPCPSMCVFCLCGCCSSRCVEDDLPLDCTFTVVDEFPLTRVSISVPWRAGTYEEYKAAESTAFPEQPDSEEN